MKRDGYIFVPSSHRLFPAAVARSIEDRAQKVIAAIEQRQAITLTPLTFDVHQQPKANRKPAMFVRALFEGKSNERVRLLFSDEPLAAENLQKPFGGLDLFVTVKDVGLAPTKLRQGLVGPSSCHIDVRSERAERIIEDVIVDIALGTFFRAQDPVRSLVGQEGLSALFRQKAMFARKRSARSWISEVERSATYAILSSLNDVADDDISSRAATSYATWLEFSRSLTIKRVTSTHRQMPEANGQLARHEIGGAASASALSTGTLAIYLAQMPRLGGQLPIRRIVNHARELPDGDYTLLVLRRSSSVRKSPSLRQKLKAIFGASPRINSFRLVSSERYLATRAIIEELTNSGHIFLANLSLKNS